MSEHVTSELTWEDRVRRYRVAEIHLSNAVAQLSKARAVINEASLTGGVKELARLAERSARDCRGFVRALIGS